MKINLPPKGAQGEVGVPVPFTRPGQAAYQNQPFITSTTATLLAGQIQGLDNIDSLRNPFRNAPWWLDEVRFSATNDSPGAGLLPNLQIQATFQRSQLTNGYIPVLSFGRVLDPAYDFPTAFGAAINPGSSMVWRFHRPLFIPPGESLVINAQNTLNPDGTSPPTMNLVVAMAGRSLDPRTPVPATIQLPWVSCWEEVLQMGGSKVTDQSRETNLYNPFDSPMFIRQFIGRVLAFNSGSTQMVELGPGEVAMMRSVLCKMFFRDGRIIVRDPTPFGHLFDVIDRSWMVNTWLAPKSYIIAQLIEDWTAFTSSQFFQPIISLVGHRDVRLE